MTAARDFALAIAESPHFREYEEAAGDLREDTAARALLSEHQEAQQTIRMLSSHDAQFRELEEKVFQHPKLHRFLRSQEGLIALVQELNKTLREDLGFDFARLAKPAGGCC